MSDKPSAAISRAGFGRQGYCKLCSFKDETQLNDRLKAGWNATQIIDWLRAHYQVSVNRKTIYDHKRHISHPEDRVVTAVQRAKERGPVMARVSSNEQFLEAIRDAGYQRAVENPDEVTIDHALKASRILASQQQRGGDTLIIFAKIATGSSVPLEVIEGEVREIST